MRKLILVTIVLLVSVVGGVLGSLAWQRYQALQRVLETRDRAMMFLRDGRVRGQRKLVLAEVEEWVSGSLVSEKKLMGIPLGETRLDYALPAKLFYAIDLSAPYSVGLVPTGNDYFLTGTFPPLELLAAEPDPGRGEKRLVVGWGRLHKYSGQYLLQKYDQSMMTNLKAYGVAPETLHKVRETARSELTGILREFVQQQKAFGSGKITGVSVRFRVAVTGAGD